MKNNWNGRCKCGHLHSEHNPIHSHNYSAGRCMTGGCRCLYFIHDATLTKLQESNIETSAKALLNYKVYIYNNGNDLNEEFYKSEFYKVLLDAMEEYAKKKLAQRRFEEFNTPPQVNNL